MIKTKRTIMVSLICLLIVSCSNWHVKVDVTPTFVTSSAETIRSAITPSSTIIPTMTPVSDLSCEETNATLLNKNDEVEFEDGFLTKITSPDFNGKTINFSPDGVKLAYANGDGVRIYSVIDGGLLCLLPSQTGIWSAIFSPDGEYLASLDGNSEVKLWNLRDGSFTVLQSPDEDGMMWTVSTKGVAFTNDGSKIAVWTDTNPNTQTFKILETGTGKVLAEIQNNSSPIANTIALSNNGEYLAIGSDKNLRVINIETKATMYTTEDSRRIGSLQFSPNDEDIYAVDWFSGEIVVWNAKTGKKIKTINTCADCEWPQDAYIRFAFGKDGKIVAAIQNYSRVNLWDTESWQLQSSLNADKALIYDIAMSSDGTKLAARVWYSKDIQPENAIYFWHLEP